MAFCLVSCIDDCAFSTHGPSLPQAVFQKLAFCGFFPFLNDEHLILIPFYAFPRFLPLFYSFLSFVYSA